VPVCVEAQTRDVVIYLVTFHIKRPSMCHKRDLFFSILCNSMLPHKHFPPAGASAAAHARTATEARTAEFRDARSIADPTGFVHSQKSAL
jgi:hypothetical protein